ncbi:ABC transporter ATP-binding protein [Halomicrococcus gelatinilyticus]|uniref:ABC transporter ATP-binding protein n=1 Tax=Halomicrococcus gelatinilyticus TaxID=1702103 RepID=UPI002E11CD5D
MTTSSSTASTDGTDTQATGERTPDEQATDRDEPAEGEGLVAEGVAKRFGDVEVLGDVSATIPGGAVTALVGPNGSGKTTLLRVLAGLVAPTDGTVTRPDARGRAVGYLPQTPAFRPQLTVAETVAHYADLVGGADVDATLDRVGLAAARDRRVGALSGGMTRLLGIATALLGDPPLVVLDEPTSGLDPTMSERVFDVANGAATDGTAVLLSSHDLGLVTERADRVVALRQGEVTAAGSVDAVTGGDRSLRAVFGDLVAGHEGRVAVRDAGGSDD